MPHRRFAVCYGVQKSHLSDDDKKACETKPPPLFYPSLAVFTKSARIIALADSEYKIDEDLKRRMVASFEGLFLGSSVL